MGKSGLPVDPFEGKPPTAPMHFDSLRVNATDVPPPGQQAVVAGLDATYRLAFVGMTIPQLPSPLRVGRVEVSQHDGPIWTQQTYIKQRPGWIPHFDKTMHQNFLAVGDGLLITLAQLPVTIPAAEHLGEAMSRWRDEVRAAVSILVALLDERLAQEELLEDLIVVDPKNSDKNASFDIARQVRTFVPTRGFLSWQEKTFESLSAIDLSEDQPAFPAARWYLRACQMGPTPDAIVFLSIALEALAPPLNRSDSRPDVMRIEDALKEAGLPVSQLQPSVGRLAGVRADVVHKGMEQPDLLNEAYYKLEVLVRLLLRYRLSIPDGSWPLQPGETMLLAELQEAERDAMSRPEISIRRVDDTRVDGEQEQL